MRALLCVLISISVAACATRGRVQVSTTTARPPEDSLETFMAKVRTLSSEARPGQASAGFEGRDPALAAAAALATFSPSPVTLRAAAEEYRRVGVFDRAFELLTKALAIDRRDAATHDAIARLWRDSGLPHLGLGDAQHGLHSGRGTWVDCTSRAEMGIGREEGPGREEWEERMERLEGRHPGDRRE